MSITIRDEFQILPKSKIKAGEGISNGLYPFFTSSDIKVLTLNEYLYDDEIVIIGTGGKPSCNYINGKFACSTDNFALKTYGRYLPKFLYYFLRKNNLKVLEEGFHGSGLKHISKDYLLDIELPSLEKSKQLSIVSEFDTINEIISKDKAQLKLYDELIKSRFIEMFMNKNFDTIQIRNVVDTNKISAKKVYKSEDKIKYIDISSIDNSNNVLTDFTPYIFSEAPSRAQQCLKPNDILVSTVRPNLKNIAAFNFEEENFVGSSGFCVLRSSKCNPSYLKYIVLSDDFTESMVKLTNGASYPAIRDDDVLNYEMINAPIELQNEFASFVELIDKSKFNVQLHLEKMKELLDKKMNEYFR